MTTENQGRSDTASSTANSSLSVTSDKVPSPSTPQAQDSAHLDADELDLETLERLTNPDYDASAEASSTATAATATAATADSISNTGTESSSGPIPTPEDSSISYSVSYSDLESSASGLGKLAHVTTDAPAPFGSTKPSAATKDAAPATEAPAVSVKSAQPQDDTAIVEKSLEDIANIAKANEVADSSTPATTKVMIEEADDKTARAEETSADSSAAPINVDMLYDEQPRIKLYDEHGQEYQEGDADEIAAVSQESNADTDADSGDARAEDSGSTYYAEMDNDAEDEMDFSGMMANAIFDGDTSSAEALIPGATPAPAPAPEPEPEPAPETEPAPAPVASAPAAPTPAPTESPVPVTPATTASIIPDSAVAAAEAAAKASEQSSIISGTGAASFKAGRADPGTNIMANGMMLAEGHTAIMGLENRQVKKHVYHGSTHITGMSPEDLEKVKQINEINSRKRSRRAEAEAKFKAEIAAEEAERKAKAEAAAREQEAREVEAAAAAMAAQQQAAARYNSGMGGFNNSYSPYGNDETSGAKTAQDRLRSVLAADKVAYEQEAQYQLQQQQQQQMQQGTGSASQFLGSATETGNDQLDQVSGAVIGNALDDDVYSDEGFGNAYDDSDLDGIVAPIPPRTHTRGANSSFAMTSSTHISGTNAAAAVTAANALSKTEKQKKSRTRRNEEEDIAAKAGISLISEEEAAKAIAASEKKKKKALYDKARRRAAKEEAAAAAAAAAAQREQELAEAGVGADTDSSAAYDMSMSTYYQNGSLPPQGSYYDNRSTSQEIESMAGIAAPTDSYGQQEPETVSYITPGVAQKAESASSSSSSSSSSIDDDGPHYVVGSRRKAGTSFYKPSEYAQDVAEAVARHEARWAAEAAAAQAQEGGSTNIPPAESTEAYYEMPENAGYDGIEPLPETDLNAADMAPEEQSPEDDAPIYPGVYADTLEQKQRAARRLQEQAQAQQVQQAQAQDPAATAAADMADNAATGDDAGPIPSGMDDGVLTQVNLAQDDNVDNGYDDGPHYVVGPSKRQRIVLPPPVEDDAPIYAVGVDRSNAEVEAKTKAERSRLHPSLAEQAILEHDAQALAEAKAAAYDQAYADALDEAARESIASPSSSAASSEESKRAQAQNQSKAQSPASVGTGTGAGAGANADVNRADGVATDAAAAVAAAKRAATVSLQKDTDAVGDGAGVGAMAMTPAPTLDNIAAIPDAEPNALSESELRERQEAMMAEAQAAVAEAVAEERALQKVASAREAHSKKQRRDSYGNYNFANMPSDESVGIGLMLFLYVRQLFASFFTYTTLPLMAPHLAMRLGPCYPSSMPIPYFFVGLLAGLVGGSLHSALNLETVGVVSAVIYLMLTGITAYKGIYRICTFITRRRHDMILLAASVMVPLLIFMWLSNILLTQAGNNLLEVSLLFAIASMLSAATASSLTWNFPQDPIDSCGIMTTKGLLFVIALCLFVAFGLMNYIVGLSVLGVSIVMRLIFGYCIAKNQGTAQRPYVYALQYFTLFAILLDLILLKSQNYQILSQPFLEYFAELSFHLGKLI